MSAFQTKILKTAFELATANCAVLLMLFLKVITRPIGICVGWYIDIESIPMSVIYYAKETNDHATTTTENHLIHRQILFCCFHDLSLMKST